MKKLIVVIFCCITTALSAQENKINKSIDDNGKTLKIKISGMQDGRKIAYKNQFNVKGLSAAQRDSIVTFVLDSLKIPAKPNGRQD